MLRNTQMSLLTSLRSLDLADLIFITEGKATLKTVEPIKLGKHKKVVCKLQKTETCKQWEVKITSRAAFAWGKIFKLKNCSFLLL